MKSKIFSSEYLLIAFFVVFLFLKASSLNLHLYWDETIYLIPSFLKDGFSVFSSKNYSPNDWHGHPPLFQIFHYFINTITPTIRLAAHLTGLISYYVFCFGAFLFFSKLIGKVTSLLLTISVTLIPFIYTQSTMFLPNYLELGLGLLSLHYLSKRDFKKYAVLISLAVLTRESAIAFSVSGLLLALYLVYKRTLTKKKLVYFFIPFIIQAIHFLFNLIASNRLIGHPLFKSRQNKGFTFFSLNNDYSTFSQSLKVATINNWPLILIIVIPLAFLISSIHRKSFFTINVNTERLFLISMTTVFYGVFFFFYADTIPRDLVLISVYFNFVTLFLLINISRDRILSNVMLSITLLFLSYKCVWIQISNPINYFTEKDQKIAVTTFREISKEISKVYTQHSKVYIPWPGKILLSNPGFEYTSSPIRATRHFDKTSNIYINAQVLSLYKKYLPKEVTPRNWNVLIDKKASNRVESYQIFIRKD